jgi:hypothetical protein
MCGGMIKNFQQNFAELSKVIPFKFRVWSWVGTAKEVWGKKIYDKYVVMWYIDARDCMDRLDEVMGPYWKRDYVDIAGKAYCSVSLYDGKQWISKSDVWERSKVAPEKWESSDSFKRACINWWLWRFLYTMPTVYITAQEYQSNRYDVSGFIKSKYKLQLQERYSKYDIKIDQIISKYETVDDWDNNDWSPDISDVTKDFSALPPNTTK